MKRNFQKALLLVGLFATPIITSGQDNRQVAKDLVEIADEAYEVLKAIDFAKEQYEQAAKLDPENIRANYMAGKTYLETVHKERATKYFKKVFELAPDDYFDILFKIGQGHQYGMEFKEAIEYYEKYLNKLEGNPNYIGDDKISKKEVERKIFECNNGIEFKYDHPENFAIVNVGQEINSVLMDYAPVLNEDETVMIFTSRRRDENLNENVDSDNFPFEDIYISEKIDGKWSSAKNIGETVNTVYHDSNIAFSKDNKLYIYKDDNNGDIYVTQMLEDGTFSPAESLGDEINSSFAESSISLSPDGNKLFFSSDREGGEGGLDIYMAVKNIKKKGNKKDAWGKVINLGPSINTEYDEDGVFMDYDGKTIFFSSRGHKGMGGYDIFKSEYDSATNQWSEPKNLGYPINTPDNDVYFVSTKDGERGYYASVRDNGIGYTDIYMITIPDNEETDSTKNELSNKDKNKENDSTNVELANNDLQDSTKSTLSEDPTKAEPIDGVYPIIIEVHVTDYDKEKPMDAKVHMTTVDEQIIVSYVNPQPGYYVFKTTNKEAQDYILSAEEHGYMFKNFKIHVPAANEKPQKITRNLHMEKLRVGFESVLHNIYFESNKAIFTMGSYSELNKLERMFSENHLEVEISGHTDNIGAADFNKKLSQKRANAVVSYLVEKGINAKLVHAVGYGEERPLASNDDEKDGRELNRRVEFQILKNGD